MNSPIVRITTDEHVEIRSGAVIVPGYVTFRQLGYDNVRNCFTFARADRRVPWQKVNARFPAAADMVRHMNRHGALARDVEGAAPSGTGQLDLAIAAASSVILAVDPKIGWAFDPKKPGVSLGSHDFYDYFDNLQHFDPATGKFATAPVADCRVVMFSVTPLPANPAGGDSLQPLNFRLVDSAGTKITVDPDIRYPGNGGTIDSEVDPNP